MNQWMCLIVGGSAGTVLRYMIAGLFFQRTGVSFPYGTLTANLVGCFAIGFLTIFLETHWTLSSSARLLLIVGFCGALTTFSTLLFEFYGLIRDGSMLRAFLYAGLSFVLGFWLFCAGIWLGNKI